jgi:hypothetical protein
LIAVSNELGLRNDKCLEDSAGQSCIPTTALKGFDMLLLGKNILRATQNVPLG